MAFGDGPGGRAGGGSASEGAGRGNGPSGIGGRGEGNGSSSGGRGRGDGPAGRAGAGDASEGTGQGNSPSGMGRGGNGGVSGSGGREGRGPGSTVGAGRRSSALGAFGGIANSLGLTSPGVTELGEIGWSGPGHRSREKAANVGQKRGAQTALDVAGARTVGSIVGAEGPVDAYGKVSTFGMTPNEERGYNEVQSQRTGLAPVGAVAKSFGPAGLLTNTAINAVDYAVQADYAKSRYGIDPSKNRRSNAVAAFTPGNRDSGSRVATAPSSQPQAVNNWMWEPASYGVGDYGSHVKGLLS
ncbi:MAG: hypothetical protein ACR2PX_21390 [Endozoicomonas sp.]|uniref:hypothetical protein n=1 Tax=Endozoicomonas sp. TaxID=1892382 RepID=UPI003D9B9781